MAGKDAASFASWLAVGLLGLVLSGCATGISLDSEPSRRSSASVADFTFDSGAPFAEPVELSRWKALAAATAEHEAALDACLSDREACESRGLARFRRLMEIAAEQDVLTQLAVVHEFFNNTTPAAEAFDRSGRDVWEPLYITASTLRGDCEDVALAKYYTLRRLGWAAEDLRVLVGWDREERDWHAMLAVRVDGEVQVLDSILGFRPVEAFFRTRLIYSISELGIWDHAPG